MRCFRLPSIVALGISLGLLPACTLTQNLTHRTVDLLSFSQPSAVAASRGNGNSIRTRNLAMEMQVYPLPLKLSDTRQLNVRITLENISRKFVQLQFPTTQRIDLLLQDASGKTIAQWSEDQSFEQVITYVGINPGERVEYSATLSTRDLKPGQPYTVTGLFPNFTELKIQQRIVPEN